MNIKQSNESWCSAVPRVLPGNEVHVWRVRSL
jgi:hypothetical protein